jgi:hypothetical protein
MRFVKDKGLIDYADEFIDRITVYSEKEEKTDVDLREEARYGALVHSQGIIEKYDFMMDVCKRCISQAEDIIYSDKEFKVPEELL